MLGVVVPVNDEQDHLPACLEALHAARVHLRRSTPHHVEVRIVLVLDRCTDGSAAVATAAGDVEVITVHTRNVGLARRAGTVHLLAGTSSRSQLWFANTDADSAVPECWLTRMLAEGDDGAHLVLGTVLPAAGLTVPQHQLWHSRHMAREGHPHVHGANFGIRGDVYQRLGGWPGLRSGEDQRFADRAARFGGLRIVRTAHIPVRTSARLHGRAPLGFSSYVRGLSTAACSA
jgi:glycosyltransferase involved in cell wall biosynthesis